MPDTWPEDPLRDNEAHQAWKTSRKRDTSRKSGVSTKQRYVQRGHQLVTCLGCGAVIALDDAAQHELEWH